MNAALQYQELDATTDTDGSQSQYSRRLCYVLLERSFDVIRQWASAVPRFDELCAHDQHLLFRSSLLEVFTLRLADRSDVGEIFARNVCCYRVDNV